MNNTNSSNSSSNSSVSGSVSVSSRNNMYWLLEDEKNASDAWFRIYKADIASYAYMDNAAQDVPITFCLDNMKRKIIAQQILKDGKIVRLCDIKQSESDIIAAVLFNPVRYPVNKTDTIGNDSLYRLRVSTNKKQKLVVLRVYVNCDELEKIMSYNSNMVPPSPLDKLIEDLGEEITNRPDTTGKYYNLISSNIKTAVVPKITDNLSWVNCIKKAKTPFEYQKANVDWMASLEKGADMKFNKIDYVDYIGLTQYKLKRANLDPTKEEINPYRIYKTKDNLFFNDESLWSNSDSTILHGGVLCDEVGLGKTLSMVGLIVRNPLLASRFMAKQLPNKEILLQLDKKADNTNMNTNTNTNTNNTNINTSTNTNTNTNTNNKIKITLKMPPPVIKKAISLTQTPINPDLLAQTLSTDTQITTTTSETNDVKSVDNNTESGVQPLNQNINDSNILDGNNKSVDKYDGLYRSVGTLVIVPARLCQQWEDEINSYVETVHKINILKITTIVQLRTYTYKDLQNADVVIVSYPFLTNKNYTMQDDISLHKVHWHRIILDEAHEVLFPTSKKVVERSTAQAIYSFKATYKWCVTGDPLAHTRTSFEGILMFLANIDYGQTKNGLLQTMQSKTIDYILERYFRRNTKLSTKEQIVIPGIKENVKFLNFTKTERAIYDNVKNDDYTRKLQLCTNILISDKDSDIIGGKVVTMENINNSMKDYYVKVAEEVEQDIAETIKTYNDWQVEYPLMMKEIQDKIKDIEQITASGNKLSDSEWAIYEDLKDQKVKLQNRDRYREKATKEKLIKLKNDLKDTQEQIKIFTELNAANYKDKPCQICNDPITETNKLCLNPCGHMNCASCIELIFNTKTNSFCPTCRKSISKASIQTITTNEQEKNKKIGETQGEGEIKSDNPILDRWGTKMAYLIEYLKEVLKNNESRVILFSQWNQMLEMVSMVLTESRIQHVFCKGNVHMITKSISKFKTDPSIRVIMLSSESCSSGNNLTEATNIILLDTPNTDKEAALAIENQAIGRLVRLGQARTVEVVRMIIKDTIEEEYYKRNHNK